MKRQALIILIFFSTFDLFAQLGKNDFILNAFGSYSKSNTELGVTKNQSLTNGKYLGLGTSVGYFITNKLVLGVGLDYNWENETRRSLLSFNRFFQIEQMDIKSNVYLPNIYLGYYQRIIDKLYFGTILKFSYGFIRSNYTSSYAGIADLQGYTLLSSSDNYTGMINGKSSPDYFSSEVCPEFTYFVSGRFGLSLGLGGIKYSLTDWDSKRSEWNVNFNPAYWSLGIKVKI